ncbi:MAG: glycosyltransferase [Bacteroidia bacterium]|nr:glycosyltransferase [Bacteroidia bacterium]
MKDLVLIIPVKDSLNTASETVRSIASATNSFDFYVFDDFSTAETRQWLDENSVKYGYQVIGLEKHTTKKSPNYRTILLMAREMSLKKNAHLVIIESDVIVKADTISGLNRLADELPNAGLIGAVTVDHEGKINFPYLKASNDEKTESYVFEHSISFCCTLLTNNFLQEFDFNELPVSLDWFDVPISKKSRTMGFNNYISKDLMVFHQPHGSRPWKMLKYSNPVLYYLKKFLFRRDRL